MQDEPEGLWYLGWFFDKGIHVPKDTRKAESCYRRAIALGNIASYQNLGAMFRYYDQPEYFLWMGKYAERSGDIISFLKPMITVLHVYFGNVQAGPSLKVDGIPSVMYQIGKSLVGNLDENAKTMFGVELEQKQLGAAKLALATFTRWRQLTRQAVDCWAIIGERIGIPMEIRYMITKMVWDTRSHGLYKFHLTRSHGLYTLHLTKKQKVN
jgi:hypothetical protein